MEMPIVGPVFKKAALSRFASIFAILQTSGVPIMQSLTILSATMGNEALTELLIMSVSVLKKAPEFRLH